MAVSALPPSPAPVNGPTAATGERKEEEVAQDPAFAMLLAGLLGPMAGMNPNMAAISVAPAPVPALAAQNPTTVAGVNLAVPAEVVPQGVSATAFEGVLKVAPAAESMEKTGTAMPLVVPVPPAKGDPLLEMPVEGASVQLQAIAPGEPVPVIPVPVIPVPVIPVTAAAKEARADGHRQSETKVSPRLEGSVLNNQVFMPPAFRTPQEKPRALENIPNPIDPARLMDALAQSVSSAKPGHYTVTLHLYPDTLGEVRMQVQVTGREVHTSMQVTNPESQKVLEDRGDQLRQALGQSGLTLSGFQVSTGAGQQTPQERRDRLNEQLAAQRRTGRVTSIQAPARPDVQRPLGRNRTGGVLDTLA